jgi:hypothetical protein
MKEMKNSLSQLHSNFRIMTPPLVDLSALKFSMWWDTQSQTTVSSANTSTENNSSAAITKKARKQQKKADGERQ